MQLFCLFLFSFFVPPHLASRPFLAMRLLLAFSSGCHSGPRAFLGFSWYLRGLSSLAPSKARFWARGGMGVLCFWCLVVVCPLLFCFAASHVLLWVLLPFFVWQRVAGTLGRAASGAFLLALLFCSRPRFFKRKAYAPCWRAACYNGEWNIAFRELL